MGWDFTNRDKGESIFSFFSHHFTHGENKVLACAAPTLGEAYLVLQEPKGVTATVCLIKHAPASYFNFGYKYIPESWGPRGYFRCPQSLIKLLSPPEQLYEGDALAWATEWRAGVQRFWTRRQAARQAQEGALVRFAQEIQFQDGHRGTDFIRVRCAGKLGNIFEDPGSRLYTRTYRIPDWRDREFEVVEQPPSTQLQKAAV